MTARQQVGGVARGSLGAVSLVGGLTWILLNLDAPRPVQEMLVGVVLAAGGLVLLMPHRVALPGRATAAATAGAAVGGTLAGGLVTGVSVGGAFAYLVSRGWPFAWLSRGGVGDDRAAAEEAANRANWHIDAVNLVADLYFWAFAGLLVVAAAVVIRRAGARREAAPQS
ncbi:hypothetical protein Adi01nite_39030 [Amorphoplanes digitatis]|nr:hypothetical protein GCM10020092_011630 [Actinoplanes digitatis]GID94491.1 hypothetical protein Adi01nite_39030 [Actinoplanes digitatis]